MRRALSLVIAGVFVLLGSSAQAQAQTINFTAALHGGNETPAAVLTGSVGLGTVSLNVATRVVTYRIDVYNMPTGTTAAHFHVGSPGTSGPTVVNFTVLTNISNDYAITGTASNIDSPRAVQGINSWDDFLQALLLGNIYMNVHSTANPGGEIRGQVIRQ